MTGIEFDFSETCIDGSLHKAPCGGEGTGKNPTDRAKLGHKWSIGVEGRGIPFAWTLDGANRNDSRMLIPTLADAAKRGLLDEIESLHLDRGYDSKLYETFARTWASTMPSSPNARDLEIGRRNRHFTRAPLDS